MKRSTKKVRRRILNTKRHTIGYIIGNQTVSVREAAQLASQGVLHGVIRVGNHIQGRPGHSPLSSLPATVR